jgi:hypothetical protein
MSLKQRIEDFRRERRLASLLRQMLAAQDAGEHEFAVDLWREYAAEHARRSPEQVARMERAQGISA